VGAMTDGYVKAYCLNRYSS